MAPSQHYNERTMEDSVATDSGAILSDGVIALHLQIRSLPNCAAIVVVSPLFCYFFVWFFGHIREGDW